MVGLFIDFSTENKTFFHDIKVDVKIPKDIKERLKVMKEILTPYADKIGRVNKHNKCKSVDKISIYATSGIKNRKITESVTATYDEDGKYTTEDDVWTIKKFTTFEWNFDSHRVDDEQFEALLKKCDSFE